jgi:CTP:molybdopterin cytidylyltransferase MocA
MTVAAVILAASPNAALADAAGQPSVRRIAELAWSGGALPIVVVAADPDGAVGAALGGTQATLVTPAAPESGPVGQVVRGIRAAAARVAGTDAALIWPARLTWAGAETVTTLIQGHGLDPVAMLRPAWDGRPGWPVLIPLAHLERLAALDPGRMPDELIADLGAAGVRVRELDLGDPGTVIDRDTPLDALPAYAGPAEPLSPPPDWGAAVAEMSDDAPAASATRLDPGAPA